MNSRGFVYVPRPSPGYAKKLVARRLSMVMTDDRASRWGYHAVPSPSNLALVAAYDDSERRARTEPGFALALGGQSGAEQTDGCIVTARSKIDTPLTTALGEVGKVLEEGSSSVDVAIESNPTFRSALEKWRLCMSRNGYHFESPIAAWNNPKWARQQTATDNEIAAARIDASCQGESGYRLTLQALTIEAISNWIKDNEAVVASWKAIEAEFRSSAQSIIDSITGS